MTVGYRAQSTAFSTDVFVGDLELQLLTTAIQAALACDSQDMGNIARRLAVRSRRLMTETLVVGMYFALHEFVKPIALRTLMTYLFSIFVTPFSSHHNRCL
jgi:hypothetical protein